MLYALRMRHFDAEINMRTIASPRGARRIRRLFAFIGPRVKVGRDTDGRGGFFDIKVPERLSGDMFEMEYDIATARAVGAETLDRHVDFIIDTDSVQRVRLLLNEAGVVANPELVGIHIGGKPSHQWPPGQFREVMRKIHSQVPCTFVITGEAADRAHARALVRTKGIPVVNLAGRLSIRELGALIRMCRLYISNDTAPMHIAAILKVPLVAIFGPGYLKRFDPRCISDKAIVLYRGAECAPCDARICLRKKCLTAISPDEVTEAVLALLRREPGGLS
jgi:ADP-heptose:LPS heptosyltransferase